MAQQYETLRKARQTGEGNGHQPQLDGDELLLAELTPADSAYTRSLLHQFRTASQVVLTIGTRFFPSAILTTEQRIRHLGTADFAKDVKGRQEYLDAGKITTVTDHSLDAGLGTSYGREKYIRDIWARTGRKGEPRIGAKGTDIYFEAPNGADPTQSTLISVMELKLCRSIAQAPSYNHLVLRPVVNRDSHPAVLDVLNSTYFPDRAQSGDNPRTYKEVLAERNITFGPVMDQKDLPNIDVKTKTLTNERTAPGSHGHVGKMVIDEIVTNGTNAEAGPRVRVIRNGDGPNNFVAPEMVGFAVKEKAGVVLLTTTRLPTDVKGGILGLERVDTEEGPIPVAQILERKQAINAGEQAVFNAMGLSDDTALPADLRLQNQPGEQYFHANTPILNEGLLAPFLMRLKSWLEKNVFKK